MWSRSCVWWLVGWSDSPCAFRHSAGLPESQGPGTKKVEAARPLDALVWNSLDVTGRSKSPSQPQFQGPGNRLHLLLKGAEKY